MADTLGFIEIFQIFLLICGVKSAFTMDEAHDVAAEQDERAQTDHRLDSLNLLMFIALLILVILTIWLFKHVRFRFVHETGLGLFYGLVIGAIIRYAGVGTPRTTEVVTLPPNSSFIGTLPPDSIRLKVIAEYATANTSKPLYFEYSYKGSVKQVSVSNIEELDEKATFDPEVFFNVLLPPIIFYAGYSMKRRHFFRNIGAIVTFAFIGTAISCFVVGSVIFGLTRLMPYLSLSFNDCLFFGALISATDPVTVLAIFHDLNVDVDLYALVFGESVLNDAVAIVLSQAIDKYSQINTQSGFDTRAVFQSLGSFIGIFSGAFALGSMMGCITALMTKFTKIRDYPLLETALFFLMSYSTFQAAEAADLTGIVAVLFCGITQAHYTYNNLSTESKLRSKQLFEVLNFCAENFVFVYIGVATFTFRKHVWDAGFIFIAFLAVLIARACNIYPLSFLLNLGRSNKIKINFQHMMMFSGLRGAIAFALVVRNTASEQRRLMLSTTLVIIIATVILCGGLSTTMLQWLKIRVGVEDETENQNFEAVRTAMTRQKKYSTMAETQNEAGSSTNVDASNPNQMQMHSPTTEQRSDVTAVAYERAWLVGKWYSFDSKFMKPFLTHSRPLLEETLPNCCAPLARILTTEQQLSQDEHQRSEDSDTDLIIDDNELTYGDQQVNNTSADGANRKVIAEQPALDLPNARSETPLSVTEDDGDLSQGNQNTCTSIPTRIRLDGPKGEAV
ncbi:sodium/hydrogen exchanger 9-like isoform X4 [Lineus longissimus]|uniref:sodium/hydrogen exchanger 9-like isoform X4 n=1 Tax=Lineus longissimus TaxID=88925 RepID=UPI00315DA53F